MKKFMAVILCILMFSISMIGCGEGQIVGGKYCDTYGLANKDMKCDGVQYKTIVGNVIWGIVLAETIVAPIYFFGFSLYEPVPGQVLPEK